MRNTPTRAVTKSVQMADEGNHVVVVELLLLAGRRAAAASFLHHGNVRLSPAH
jgi:hypothetical protein